MSETVEIILSISARCLAFILSSAIYVFLIARFLPRRLLSPRYSVKKPTDRGLKKYLFPEGRAIVYKPSREVSKYIDQYILQSKNEEKSIVCRGKSGVNKIRYDVSAFDVNGRLIDTIQIYEGLKLTHTTKETELPLLTAYVYIAVKEINGIELKDSPKLSFSLLRLGVFFALCVVLSVIESLIVRGVILSIIYSINRSAYIEGSPASVLTGIAVGAILSGLIFLLHLSKETKIEK